MKERNHKWDIIEKDVSCVRSLWYSVNAKKVKMAKPLENKVMYRQKRLAFTILEILVALSMLALILTAVYGSYTAATTAVVHCKPKNALEQQARLFLERMTCELRCCFASRANEARKDSFESRPEREVLQREEPPLFVGKDASSGQTFLQFVTSAVMSRQPHNIGGLATVSYRLDKSGTVLLRSERRYVDRFENDDDDYNWLVAFANVKSITLEYFDGEKWKQQWDSDESVGLPNTVRISLVLDTEDTGPLSFIAAAHITCRVYQTPAVTVQETTARSRDSVQRENAGNNNDPKRIKK